MANKGNRPRKGSGRRGRNSDTVKVIALITFIAIGIGVVGGTVWYYAFFQPQAAENIETATLEFTKDFFNVSHASITGNEGADLMTEALAQSISSGDRARVWKERELVSKVEGDVQVTILDQGLRSARTRATFWQYEEYDENAGKEYLVYYDYAFVYEGGEWLIDNVLTASEEGLKELRKARGVYDQHYADDEDDADADDDDDTEDTEDEDTEDGGSE